VKSDRLIDDDDDEDDDDETMKIMMIIMMMAMTLKIMKMTFTTMIATVVDDGSVNGNNDYDDNIQNDNINK
jgi:hypothetical protein